MKTNQQFDLEHIWHPYTSMLKPLPTYQVKQAKGVFIELETGEQLIDGMSSWWSIIHGYNHPVLNQAIHEQTAKMAHVMFGGLTHQPAIDLCRKLVEIAPDGLNKVFLADSGSVAVEVALKMAIQYWRGKNKPQKNKMVALKHGYHGDTFGAMSVCDPENSMHTIYSDILPNHYFVEAPKTQFDENLPSDNLVNDVAAMTQLLQHHHDDIAAVILEPIVQGAGGMRMYHPAYLASVKQLCEQYDVLLIADEIATGFGRTGQLFGCHHAHITPDIMCVGKALTGGYLSLAATLCTDEVAMGVSTGDAGVLMHGPTFMGNPLACSVANASLNLLESSNWQSSVSHIEQQLKQSLIPLASLKKVHDARVLGAIGVIEMEESVDVADVQKRFIRHGVWVRPFGKLIYIMPPFVISNSELTVLINAMVTVVTELSES
ncbi:adenosylmethionine--8-amino-7-oxononanoate transaminase [Flocculibacter collagenilyticus]|uniref:adenosylmethionine--8-amino-7-oxononanoate transaminase n=1 Tax=Flocculibacter collagenilyticus TaxID=2744479 RepID=UPI0018F76933|nr:adenosylmethionine--8-amino-7-oxononanoate transaminase [Flocculibacter collagenilyticus]